MQLTFKHAVKDGLFFSLNIIGYLLSLLGFAFWFFMVTLVTWLYLYDKGIPNSWVVLILALIALLGLVIYSVTENSRYHKSFKTRFNFAVEDLKKRKNKNKFWGK